MGQAKNPLPGKLIVSALYSNMEKMVEAISQIEKKYGRAECETDEMEFSHTDYYGDEMGENLKRKFFSFAGAVDRSELADIKIWTNRLEEKYAQKSGDCYCRTVNLDPGILTPANLTLASTKDFSHRIYLRDGIFAEVTLIYTNKKFMALPWTYPDYNGASVTEFLTRVRESLNTHDIAV